jgi:hypothetical protein
LRATPSGRRGWSSHSFAAIFFKKKFDKSFPSPFFPSSQGRILINVKND